MPSPGSCSVWTLGSFSRCTASRRTSSRVVRGLGGPAELARRAMHSGEFLVIENDLTRCLGVGDLTVVFAARRWKHPISYEVKSSARPAWRLGAELQIEAIAAVSDDPADVELHERFTAATGFGDLPATMRSREQPAQTAEQLSAAE